MKKIIFARQGVELKLVSIIIQNLIATPIFLLLSYIITSIILSIIDFDTMKIFKIVMIILNLVWIFRNSIIKLSKDKIICKNMIGANKIYDINDMVSIELINSKQLKSKLLKSSGMDPLNTNCFSLIFPPNNAVLLKNKYNREIVICSWNYDILYNYINKSLKNKNLCYTSQIVSKASTSFDYSVNKRERFVTFVKMPFFNYVILYFKRFCETIILPLFFVFFSKWLFSIVDVVISKYICIGCFVILSGIMYAQIIKVVVKTDLKIIRLNLFYNNNKNIIKFDSLYDLKYMSLSNDFETVKNKSSAIIVPYNKKNLKDVISFKLENGISIIMSVYKSQTFYNLLNRSLNS